MITKENYLTARYTDNEKKNVEVLYKEGSKTISYILQHDTKHPDWQNLMKITTLDEIHLNTHNYIKISKKNFKKMVMKIAEEEKVVPEVIAELSTPFFKEVFDFFYDYSEEKGKEMLFNFKLFMFEKDFVKISKNTEVKAEMRKAQSPLELLNAVMKLK